MKNHKCAEPCTVKLKTSTMCEKEKALVPLCFVVFLLCSCIVVLHFHKYMFSLNNNSFFFFYFIMSWHDKRKQESRFTFACLSVLVKVGQCNHDCGWRHSCCHSDELQLLHYIITHLLISTHGLSFSTSGFRNGSSFIFSSVHLINLEING